MATKYLCEVIKVRVSQQEKAMIKFLADQFAGGNVSLWVVYCALNAPRELLTSKSIEDTKRKRKTPQKEGLKS